MAGSRRCSYRSWYGQQRRAAWRGCRRRRGLGGFVFQRVDDLANLTENVGSRRGGLLPSISAMTWPAALYSVSWVAPLGWATLIGLIFGIVFRGGFVAVGVCFGGLVAVGVVFVEGFLAFGLGDLHRSPSTLRSMLVVYSLGLPPSTLPAGATSLVCWEYSL